MRGGTATGGDEDGAGIVGAATVAEDSTSGGNGKGKGKRPKTRNKRSPIRGKGKGKGKAGRGAADFLSGIAKRFHPPPLRTPEDIARWREERRKNFPTRANIRAKEEAKEQRERDRQGLAATAKVASGSAPAAAAPAVAGAEQAAKGKDGGGGKGEDDGGRSADHGDGDERPSKRRRVGKEGAQQRQQISPAQRRTNRAVQQARNRRKAEGNTLLGKVSEL